MDIIGKYTCFADDLQVDIDTDMPEDGIIIGSEGAISYHRCDDGISIKNSPFPESGFVITLTSAHVNVPASINGIPVVEVHQDVYPQTTHPISIEGRNLKRAFINIYQGGVERDLKQNTYSVEQLLIKMYLMGDSALKEDIFDIDLCICCKLEELYVSCKKKCAIVPLNVKNITVDAPEILIKEGKFGSNVQTICFKGNVKPFVYQGWDGDEVYTDIFCGLSKLETIEGTLGGKSGWDFHDCTSLKAVHLGNGCKSLRSFRNCRSLRDIYIPDTVENLGSYTFENCISLLSVHIPDQVSVITEGVFKNCFLLGKCFLSDNIVEIRESAFEGCSSLTRPWIPKNLQTIGKRAFYGCKSLGKITIPNEVTDIGEEAFAECPNIVIHCHKGSAAHQYAEKEGVQFELFGN